MDPRRPQPPEVTIIVEIDDVDLTNRIIHVRDKMDGLLKIAWRDVGAVVRVPKAGERWTASRRGVQWHLGRKLDNDEEHLRVKELSPGDSLLAASGDIVLDADGEIQVQSLIKVSEDGI